MAHTRVLTSSAPERGQQCPNTEDEKDSVDPYYLETPYGYQLDLDFLKYVDDIERGNTIKKLNIQRKSKVARPLAGPRGSTSSGGGIPAEWTSTDSLSSSNSDDNKPSPLFLSSRSQPAPLTPNTIRASSASEPPYHLGVSEPPYHLGVLEPPYHLGVSEPKQLLPPPSPRVSHPLHNSQVEKTLMETRRRLEQERLLMQPSSDAPATRRRLASFGGLGSSSSLSSFSGSMAPSQISPSAHQTLPLNGHFPNGEYNLYYPPSMGSSIRHSPMSSGMTTPVTNVSPLHLQHIREQMVVALKRLKELEEQVKTIPILQVKIAVLQEEKRQLAAQSKNPLGGFRKRSYSVGSADQLENPGTIPKEAELHIVEPETQEQSSQRLEEFRRLAAEVQALERNQSSNGAESQDDQSITTQNQTRQQSIGIGTDENMNDLSINQMKPKTERCFHDVGVGTDQKEMCSAGMMVTEVMLGMTSEAEAEIELQQQTIEALKEKIYRLEGQLKDTTHQMEMGKLKLELQAAGGSNKKKADKGSMAKPEMYSACVEAKVTTHSQGVGNHLEWSNACTTKTIQTHSVGVSCKPCVYSTAVGPDVPLERWVVRERVDLKDQCVSTQVEVCHQCVGMELDVCEVGINTEMLMDSLTSSKPVLESNKESRSIGCGECSVDVTIRPVREYVTQATETDVVSQADCSVMATPETASQQTSTDMEAVSAATNTETVTLADCSTSTSLVTCDKQTNTSVREVKTVAVGEGLVRDIQASIKTRSIAVGTASELESSPGKSSPTKTKDCSVGAVSIHQNFLVGLKTRSIACGPSEPPDMPQSGSRDTATAKAQDRPAQGPDQDGAGIDHYIERVQKLLQEQQMLLAENYSELADAFGQPNSQFSSINSQLVTTLSSINTAMRCGSVEELLKLEDLKPLPRPAESEEPAVQPLMLRVVTSGGALREVPPGERTAATGQPQPPPAQPTHQQCATADQKSRMDLQMSTALHGQPCSPATLKSIMKKKDGRSSSSTKKSLQFVGVNGGYETTSSDDSSSEESSSSEEEEEDEEEDQGGRSTQQSFQNQDVVEKSEKEGSPEMEEKAKRYELSEKMLSACNVLNTHLSNPRAVASKDLRACLSSIQHEWFRVSSQKDAMVAMVTDYLEAFRAVSPAVLRHIVNMADGNGNTALHYSVSHSNFRVVKKLLDANACNVNQQNKAGYTPIMLAALAAVEMPADMCIVEELFSLGDVNARASQAGQTGLMLAVSHGRMDMVRALLAQGADVNVQDDEGSTALMCASEHGHVEIVKLLLAQPGCDATLSDSDESNALSIALEAGHKDIAVLLYAHVNFSKAQSPGTPRLSRKASPSPTRRGMFD